MFLTRCKEDWFYTLIDTVSWQGGVPPCSLCLLLDKLVLVCSSCKVLFAPQLLLENKQVCSVRDENIGSSAHLLHPICHF